MPLWIVFLLLAWACGLVGTLIAQRKKSAVTSNDSEAMALTDLNAREINMPSDINLPPEWSEQSITSQLRQLRDHKPALIPHFIDSVVERFVVRQDDKTAATRLTFMRSQIEQLK